MQGMKTKETYIEVERPSHPGWSEEQTMCCVRWVCFTNDARRYRSLAQQLMFPHESNVGAVKFYALFCKSYYGTCCTTQLCSRCRQQHLAIGTYSRLLCIFAQQQPLAGNAWTTIEHGKCNNNNLAAAPNQGLLCMPPTCRGNLCKQPHLCNADKGQCLLQNKHWQIGPEPLEWIHMTIFGRLSMCILFVWL